MKTLVSAALAAAISASAAFAGDIMAMDAFAYGSTKMQKAGAAFIPLMTHGGPDRLLSAASPAAKKVEIHTHIMQDGVMKMRKVPEPLAISDGHPIEMKPGGNHVMLMGLTQQLVPGETVPVTLTFESGETLTVDVPVKARGETMGEGHGMNHGKASD